MYVPLFQNLVLCMLINLGPTGSFPAVCHQLLHRPVDDLTVGFRVLKTLDFPGFGHFHDVTYFPCFLLQLIFVVPSRRLVYERDELFRLRSPDSFYLYPELC
jgi:hypothetical protein